jgi:Na+/phosphate symporter
MYVSNDGDVSNSRTLSQQFPKDRSHINKSMRPQQQQEMLISWIDSNSRDIMEVINSKDATTASKTRELAKMPANQGHVQEQIYITSF